MKTEIHNFRKKLFLEIHVLNINITRKKEKIEKRKDNYGICKIKVDLLKTFVKTQYGFI